MLWLHLRSDTLIQIKINISHLMLFHRIQQHFLRISSSHKISIETIKHNRSFLSQFTQFQLEQIPIYNPALNRLRYLHRLLPNARLQDGPLRFNLRVRISPQHPLVKFAYSTNDRIPQAVAVRCWTRRVECSACVLRSQRRLVNAEPECGRRSPW